MRQLQAARSALDAAIRLSEAGIGEAARRKANLTIRTLGGRAPDPS